MLVSDQALPSRGVVGPPRGHLRCGQWAAPHLGPRSIPHPAWVLTGAFHSLLAGDQEALQPHPGRDLPLLLVPPPDQQPHLLHRGAGKPPPSPAGHWAPRWAESESCVHSGGSPRSHRPSAMTAGNVSSGGELGAAGGGEPPVPPGHCRSPPGPRLRVCFPGQQA